METNKINWIIRSEKQLKIDLAAGKISGKEARCQKRLFAAEKTNLKITPELFDNKGLLRRGMESTAGKAIVAVTAAMIPLMPVSGMAQGGTVPDLRTERSSVPLYRAGVESGLSPTSLDLVDVTPSDPTYEAVQWAIQQGLLDVYLSEITGEFSFHPEDGITHEQLQKVAARLYELMYSQTQLDVIENKPQAPEQIVNLAEIISAFQQYCPELPLADLNEIATKVLAPEVIEADTEITRAEVAQILFALDGLMNPHVTTAVSNLKKSAAETITPVWVNLTSTVVEFGDKAEILTSPPLNLSAITNLPKASVTWTVKTLDGTGKVVTSSPFSLAFNATTKQFIIKLNHNKLGNFPKNAQGQTLSKQYQFILTLKNRKGAVLGGWIKGVTVTPDTAPALPELGLPTTAISAHGTDKVVYQLPASPSDNAFDPLTYTFTPALKFLKFNPTARTLTYDPVLLRNYLVAIKRANFTANYTYTVKDKKGETDKRTGTLEFTYYLEAPTLNSFNLDKTNPAITLDRSVLVNAEANNASHYRVYEGNTPPADNIGWVAIPINKAEAPIGATYKIKSAGNGSKTITVELKGPIAGRPTLSQSITLYEKVPSNVSFTINGNAASTNSRIVTLTPSATSATEWMVSEKSNFAGATWQPYQPGNEDYTIGSTGNGKKTIYIKWRNPKGVSVIKSRSITLSETAPAAPTGLTATAGDGTVTLNWTDVANETSYEVYSATTSGGPYTKVTTLDAGATSYQASNLTNGTPYYFLVKAANSLGATGSTEVSATPVAPPPSETLPAAPTNLTATAGNGVVNLSWVDNATNETSYEVYHANTSGGPYTKVATLGASATSYQDINLTNGLTYYLKVFAVNSAGATPSNEASATPEAPSVETAPTAPGNLTATAGNGTITLNWTDSNGETNYEVWRSAATSDVGSFSLITAMPANSTSFQDTNLTNGVKYTYKIKALNDAGSSISDLAFATPEAPAPALELSGVDTDGRYNQPRTVTFATGLTATIEKNGGAAEALLSGTTVSAEGVYIIRLYYIVNSQVLASKDIPWVMDLTAPQISGVVNNGKYSTTITPTLTNNEPNLQVELKKDNVVVNGYTLGTAISTDGVYQLTALDGLNTTILNFERNSQTPVIGGITEGATYNSPVTPTFNVPCTATLNGQDYLTTFATTGPAIDVSGHNILIVTNQFGSQKTVTWYSNHVPVINNDTETVTQNHEYTFTLDDFALTDSDGTSEEKIKITAITHGKVKLSGTEVALDQEITVSDITNGNLKFISDLNFAGEADISWQGYSGSLWSNIALKQITVSPDVIAPTINVVNKQSLSRAITGTAQTVGDIQFNESMATTPVMGTNLELYLYDPVSGNSIVTTGMDSLASIGNNTYRLSVNFNGNWWGQTPTIWKVKYLNGLSDSAGNPIASENSFIVTDGTINP